MSIFKKGIKIVIKLVTILGLIVTVLLAWSKPEFNVVTNAKETNTLTQEEINQRKKGTALENVEIELANETASDEEQSFNNKD